MPNSATPNTSHQEKSHHDPHYNSEGDSLKNGPSKWKGKGKKNDHIKPGSAEDILRSMPVDADAERAVLSCMLKDPTNIIPMAENVLKSPDFFYIPAHKIIFETIISLYRTQQGGKLDVILLNSELQDQELMDRVGGPKFVADLLDDVPTTAMFGPYVEVLKKKFILRRVISDCTKCVAEAYDHPENAAVFLDGVEKSVLKIRDETENQAEIKNMKTSVMNVVQTLEQIMNGGVSLGLMTGFKDIDKMTNGLHGGEMIVVAARPAMGKTSFVMNIVENIAIREKDPVPSAIFSLEMTAESLVQRVLCSRAKVHMSKLRGGFLSKQDFPKLMKVAGEMAEAPIWIDDTPGLSINELRAKARRLKQQHNIGFIAIDYLQLLKAPDTASRDGREKEVAEISGGIKGIAKELNIPIIVLAQLNRNPDGRGGKPKMSDLRESGSIEQDADLVGLLMREEYYAENEEDREEKSGSAEFIIAKQRNGGTGEIPLTFEKEFMRFGNAALDHHQE
ncbi:MAG: replicative DNA helicase [Verrucomicrobiales bacterium]|nr:replicative DNA helicase [Verrucomicrobiales bacterium]